MARLKIRKASKKKGKFKYSVMEKGIRTAAGRQTIKSVGVIKLRCTRPGTKVRAGYRH